MITELKFISYLVVKKTIKMLQNTEEVKSKKSVVRLIVILSVNRH